MYKELSFEQFIYLYYKDYSISKHSYFNVRCLYNKFLRNSKDIFINARRGRQSLAYKTLIIMREKRQKYLFKLKPRKRKGLRNF